jgi:hypothetical protein
LILILGIINLFDKYILNVIDLMFDYIPQ